MKEEPLKDQVVNYLNNPLGEVVLRELAQKPEGKTEKCENEKKRPPRVKTD